VRLPYLDYSYVLIIGEMALEAPQLGWHQVLADDYDEDLWDNLPI
jgi:hypothetical protein